MHSAGVSPAPTSLPHPAASLYRPDPHLCAQPGGLPGGRGPHPGAGWGERQGARRGTGLAAAAWADWLRCAALAAALLVLQGCLCPLHSHGAQPTLPHPPSTLLPQAGQQYRGRVVRLLDFGAMLELEGLGLRALLHISEVAPTRIRAIDDVLQARGRGGGAGGEATGRRAVA